MANPITYLATPVNITPTDDGTWRTVDLSAHIASGSSGVLLRSRYSTSTSVDVVGFRKTGSTDNLTAQHAGTPTYVYTMVGVDASRQVDIQLGDGGAGAGTIELLAYFDPASVVFFTNCVIFDTVSQNAYVDWNVASATGGDTAIAVILYLHSTRGNPTEVAWRKNGSSEDIKADHSGATGGRYIGTVIVPVDGSEILEVLRASNTYGDFKMIGYITANYTATDPGTDVTPASNNTWTDITQAGALAQFIDYAATAIDFQFGFRKNGDSSVVGYGALDGNGERLPALVECDASGIIEAQVDNSGAKMYRRGYFTAVSGSPGNASGAGVSDTATAAAGSAAQVLGSIAFTGINKFIAKNGAAVASQALTFYVWRSARPPGSIGTPDQIVTGTTGSGGTAGEITIQINPAGLSNGAAVFVMAFAAGGTQKFFAGECTVAVS